MFLYHKFLNFAACPKKKKKNSKCPTYLLKGALKPLRQTALEQKSKDLMSRLVCLTLDKATLSFSIYFLIYQKIGLHILCIYFLNK